MCWAGPVGVAALTQLAIDQKLTVIAFEAMNHWNSDGSFNLHVFHKNNELAGYCSVVNAMKIAGSTGAYGRRLRAVVIGFGATARGAVAALNALDVHDVDILTHREVAAVAAPMHSARIVHFDDHQPQRGGHEQTGARYAVVVQNDDLPLTTWLIAPTSTSAHPATFRPEINIGGRPTRVLAEETAAADPTRLGDDIGHVAPNETPHHRRRPPTHARPLTTQDPHDIRLDDSPTALEAFASTHMEASVRAIPANQWLIRPSSTRSCNNATATTRSSAVLRTLAATLRACATWRPPILVRRSPRRRAASASAASGEINCASLSPAPRAVPFTVQPPEHRLRVEGTTRPGVIRLAAVRPSALTGGLSRATSMGHPFAGAAP